MILLEIKDAFSTSSYCYESLEDKEKKLTAIWQKYIRNDFYSNFSNYLNQSTRVYTTTYATNTVTTSAMAEPIGNLYYMDYVCGTTTNNR